MKPFFLFPGTHLPLAAKAKSGQLTREQMIFCLQEAAGSRDVHMLDHPDQYRGEEGDVVFGWNDECPAETREQLLRYPHIKFLNRAMVLPREEGLRFSIGYPDPYQVRSRAPMAALPQHLQLKVMDGAERTRRIALNKVMILTPTPAAALFHGTTYEASAEKLRAAAAREFPGAEIHESVHPTIAKERGLPLTDELVKDVRAAFSLQSGAVVDKCLVNGIDVYVNWHEHPLAGCPDLPKSCCRNYVEISRGAAVRALKQAGAWEFPVTVEGCRMMLAA